MQRILNEKNDALANLDANWQDLAHALKDVDTKLARKDVEIA
jgi:hypothetical protein